MELEENFKLFNNDIKLEGKLKLLNENYEKITITDKKIRVEGEKTQSKKNNVLSCKLNHLTDEELVDYVVSWYLEHHTIEQITNDSVVTALFSEDGTSLVSYSHLPEKAIQKIREAYKTLRNDFLINSDRNRIYLSTFPTVAEYFEDDYGLNFTLAVKDFHIVEEELIFLEELIEYFFKGEINAIRIKKEKVILESENKKIKADFSLAHNGIRELTNIVLNHNIKVGEKNKNKVRKMKMEEY